MSDQSTSFPGSVPGQIPSGPVRPVPRERTSRRLRGLFAIAVVSVFLTSSLAGLAMAGDLTGVVGGASVHPAPAGSTFQVLTVNSSEGFAPNGSAASLTLSNGIGSLPSTFWGVNYNYAAPSGPDQNNFANSTIAQDYNETPISWIRLPLVSPEPGASYNTSFNWASVFEFCDWVHCHSLVTVGGANETAQNGAWEVQYIEDHYHFYPDYWIFGNEPNVYDWASPSAYASTVHQWILDVRAFDPTAQFMGISVSGDPGVDDAYLTDLMEQDGSLINAFAIQTYPDQPPDLTLANFMASLTGPHNILFEAENARSIVDAYGGSDLPMFDNEFQGGGTGITAWAQFRQGYPDVPYTATAVIQALDAHVAQLSPWTFASVDWLNPGLNDGCDNAMIELSGTCEGVAGTYNPSFYLQTQILKQIPYGSLTNVTLPGVPGLWGIQVTNGTTRDVLVANDNISQPRTFDLGPGFPVSGNLSTRLLDPANPEQPLENVLPLNSNSPSFTLPALGVLLLQFTPESAAPPPTGTGGAPPTPHTVTFVRSGLPTGTNWSVSLNGLTQSDPSPSIAFTGVAGRFAYNIPAVPGYHPMAAFGTGNASQGNLSIPVAFATGAAPTLAIVSFSSSPAIPQPGAPFMLTVETTGGDGPYAYSYAGLPLTCQPADGPSIPCSSTPKGTYGIAVSVADSSGGQVETGINLTVADSTSGPIGAETGGDPFSGFAADGLLAVFAALIAGGVIAGVEVMSVIRRRHGSGRPSGRHVYPKHF